MANAALAAASGRLAAAIGAGAGTLARALAEALSGERDRWVLWTPVALGLGIGVYFELAAEPAMWPALALVLAAALLAFASRRNPAALAAACALLAGAGGFLAAKLETEAVRAPVLTKRLGPVVVRGRVAETEPTRKGLRVLIRLEAAGRLRPEEMPRLVRLTLHEIDHGVSAGDRIAVRAMLLPPPPPAAPGAYDFQRQAFFLGIGAIGYALGEPEVLARATDGGFSFHQRIDRLRQRITERIIASLPSPTGAVSAALITGYRDTIPNDIIVAMQNSGLAHLLAISGMNIAIVAGAVFFALRGLLALYPWLALRISTKKWAALGALVLAFLYVLISGSSIPTLRAFLMLAAVSFGTLIDREALSMRLVAWAAAAILLAEPDSMLGPSFQMSFAAVVALIACYERWMQRKPRPDPPHAVWRWLRGFGTLALTSLVAGLATAPFGMYSFNRFTIYGLAANMMAVPATDLWIMPCALLAMLAIPFGLEHAPLVAMGWGVDFVNWVARMVASWPGAVVSTTVMPGWGLLIFSIGGLWLAIWQRRWRWGGIGLMAAGLLSLLLVRPPDLLVSGDGKAVAVRAADGVLYLLADNARSYVADVWFKREGAAGFRTWPWRGASPDGRLRCDALGCIYRIGSTKVALLRQADALAEDCGAARLVVAPALTRTGCPGAAIDRRSLMTRGAHIAWVDATGIRILDDRTVRGERPWVTYPWRDRPPWKGHTAKRFR